MSIAKLIPLNEISAAGQARLEAMDERRKQDQPRIRKTLQRLEAHQANPRAALSILREIADILTAETRGLVPCKRGCNACCHMPVAVAAGEAALIAKEIGVPLARHVEHRTDFTKDPFGAAHPCQFLKAGECSIYAYRPMACRTHFSTEDSPAPCGFGESGKQVGTVKLLSVLDINTLYVEVMMMAGDKPDQRLNSLDRWFAAQ